MSQPFNSFGINPTIFQNMPPPIPHTVAGPSAFMGHGPALVNPMQQEKPLQLNQLPGFNLFNVSIKIQIFNKQAGKGSAYKITLGKVLKVVTFLALKC